MYWESIRLYSASNSKTPHQSSFADRQNESAKIVPDFLACLYYFYGKDFSPKVFPFSFIETDLSHRGSTRTLFQSDTKYRDIFF